jgi:serine/threonine-protein kinase
MVSVDNLSGKTLRQYELRKLIGTGGMGAVYMAFQPSLQREIAIKVLPNSIAADPQAVERFNREALVSASLEHPHIVPVYDYGTEGDVNFVAMRLLSGGSLEQRMRYLEQGKMPLPQIDVVIRILSEVAAGLDYAHQEGVIHRDIKASNIMFDKHGTAFIVDFGIARIAELTSHLTGTGTALGTPAYMAPEQWRGDTPLPAADQYSLGCMAYLLLTGALPFTAANPYALLQKHTQELPPPLKLHRDDLPPALEGVMERVLAKRSEDRFPSCVAFVQALEAAARYNIPANAGSIVPARPQALAQAAAPEEPAAPTIQPPLNPNEQLRDVMRVLFARAYGRTSSPLKRKVAYKYFSRADGDQLQTVLLQDFIRGGFAENVLRAIYGDTFDGLMLHLRGGDVARVRELIHQTPLDGAALAGLLTQDYRSISSNNRISLVRVRDDQSDHATVSLMQQAQGGQVADIVRAVFKNTGDTHAAGMTYLHKLKSAETIPVLFEIAHDATSSTQSRIEAIELIAVQGDAKQIAALKQLARQDDAVRVRGAAIVAIIQLSGTIDGIVEGFVKVWGAVNESLAYESLAQFADSQDYDDILRVMVNNEQPEDRRRTAAAVLAMSGQTDYSLPIARFLNEEAQAKERWRAFITRESENATPAFTDLFAKTLRNLTNQTLLQPATKQTFQTLELLMVALIRLGNERAMEALGGIKGNTRLDAKIREAADKALMKIQQRRSG